MSLLISNNITNTKEDIRKMQTELKEYEQNWIKSQSTWERMEAELGEVKGSLDDVKERLKTYETPGETFNRWDLERKIRDNLRYLSEIECMAEIKENRNRIMKEMEEDDKKFQEKWDRVDKEFEWWDAYFDTDFKKMGYIYIPAWCYYRPQGILKEEYGKWMKGENLGKKRVILSISALSSYFVISVYSLTKLFKYIWACIQDKIEKIMTLKEELRKNYKRDFIKDTGLDVIIKAILFIVLIKLLYHIGKTLKAKNIVELDNSKEG